MSHNQISTTSLWRDQSFVLYWLGRAISLLGTAITSVVLPILIYRLTASALLTSLLAACEVAPYLIFGLIAGALADTVNRRRLMVACDFLNTLLIGSIPLAALLNILTIAHIFIVALLSASAYVWFDAADFGALPTLVGRDRIVAAYSAIGAAGTFVQIIGPAVGGVLAATIGSAPTLSLDTGSYLLSAISLLLIVRALSPPRQPQPQSSSPTRRHLGSIREGLSFLWRHPLLRTLILFGFGNSLIGGVASGLLIVYTVRALGIPSTDARLGLLFTAGALGSLVANLLFPRLTKRIPAGWLTLGAILLNAFFLLGLALTTSFIAAFAIYTCWEFCYTVITMVGITMRQLITPEPLLSRVNTYARMVAWGGTPFGAAIGGLLAQWLPIRTTYLLMTSVLFLCLIFGLLSPLRQRAMARELAQESEA